MRVAIYSRKSIETDTGDSIQNQIHLCKVHFESKEPCTFEIFEDEGFSGSNTNRPSFQRMMGLIKMKQFDAVAVYKVDRIARNIVDFVNTYDQLEKLNVKLVSVTECFDPSTTGGKMLMLILASFAEMERMNIAQRVKDNMRELAKLGRWSGGTPPTGYITKKVIENGKKITYLELDNSIAPDINEMFKMYSRGLTTYEISKHFKDKNLNYPDKTIYNILSNPTYLESSKESIKYLESEGYTVYGEANGNGFLPYNRRPKTNGKKEWNHKNKFVGVSKHKPVVDIETWISVQEKFKEKTVDPHPRESNFSFLTGGLVKCKCGSGMFISANHRRKDGSRIYYFRCSRTADKNCTNKFLRVDVAENSIMEFLKSLTDKDKLIKYRSCNKSDKDIDKQIKLINSKIKTNDKAIDNLANRLALVSDDLFEVLSKKANELIENNKHLKEQLLSLERQKLFEKMDYANMDLLYSQIQKFVSFDLPLDDKKKLIKTIISKVVWDSDNSKLTIELLK